MLSSNSKRPVDNFRYVSFVEVALPICPSEAFHKDGSPLSVRLGPRCWQSQSVNKHALLTTRIPKPDCRQRPTFQSSYRDALQSF